MPVAEIENEFEQLVDENETDWSLRSHQVALCSVDWQCLESEDKLGCARGVLWAIALEAAVAIAAVACWRLHFLAH
jgi:hypothetical protein